MQLDFKVFGPPKKRRFASASIPLKIVRNIKSYFLWKQRSSASFRIRELAVEGLNRLSQASSEAQSCSLEQMLPTKMDMSDI